MVAQTTKPKIAVFKPAEGDIPFPVHWAKPQLMILAKLIGGYIGPRVC
jgi:hypothetical protein